MKEVTLRGFGESVSLGRQAYLNGVMKDALLDKNIKALVDDVPQNKRGKLLAAWRLGWENQSSLTPLPNQFNNLRENETPDWSKYDALEVAPVLEEDGNCERLEEEDGITPSFWSVYGHLKTGGVECLHDCFAEEDADALADAILKINPEYMQ